MKVLKFGGTSLKDADRYINVFKIIKHKIKEDSICVVLSAVSGITNALDNAVNAAKNANDYKSILAGIENTHSQIIQSLSKQFKQFAKDDLLKYLRKKIDKCDVVLSAVKLLNDCPDSAYCEVMCLGERLSTKIMYELLKIEQTDIKLLDPIEYIITEGVLTDAMPVLEHVKEKFSSVKNEKCLVMSGYIASDLEGKLSLLGRNSSDYSASLAAVGLQASACEIWTDVDGVYTADPNKVKDAKLIDKIGYEEAIELSHYGSHVLHPKAISVLVESKIPLYIKNTFNPELPGTEICNFDKKKSEYAITAISCMKNIALVNVFGTGMKGVAGMAAKIFNIIANSGASIILISQDSSECNICFAIKEKDVGLASKALYKELKLELDAKIIEEIDIQKNKNVICAVGDNMRTKFGISGKLFSSLAQAAVNIVAISQGGSERCISAVINTEDNVKALNAVHDCFFDGLKTIQLYIVGCGSVGAELIGQISSQQEELKKYNIDIKVCGIVNSKSFIYSDSGLKLDNWRDDIANLADKKDLTVMLEDVKADRPINGILVDCTSSEVIASNYIDIINSGLHIVTANKKANTMDIKYYNKIRRRADKQQRLFQYETNVGAGLPIIDTFKGLLKSGDELINFSGILSGSLSYIFGMLDENLPFSQAVKLAAQQKFTEPDPRDDLSGMDVARKLLILARECGSSLEMDDIIINPIFPEDIDLSGSVQDMFAKLKNVDGYFEQRMAQCRHDNKVLRYVGEIDNGKCIVGLKEVSVDHPLYVIKNGENAFVFLTKRYNPMPLVVRGYGAGVGVTASGLFYDVLKIANVR